MKKFKVEIGLPTSFLNGLNTLYNEYSNGYESIENIELMRSSTSLYLEWMKNNILEEERRRKLYNPITNYYDRYAYFYYRAISSVFYVDPYKYMNLAWNFHYDMGLINHLQKKPSRFRKKIISITLLIAQGKFENVTLYKFGPLIYSGIFYYTLDTGNLLPFCILPERVPIVGYNSQVTGYEYNQYLRFMDIVSDTDAIDMVVNKHLENIASSHNSFIAFKDTEHCKILSFYENGIKDDTKTLHNILITEQRLEDSRFKQDSVCKPKLESIYIKADNIKHFKYNSEEKCMKQNPVVIL